MEFTITETYHGYRRMKDRGLSRTMVDIVYQYGEEWRDDVYIIPRKSVRGLLECVISTDDRELIKAAAHRQTAIVVSPSGALITAIKHSKGRWLIKKDWKYNRNQSRKAYYRKQRREHT